MNTFSFALAAGFYFWIGPIGLILLIRRQIGEKRIRSIALSVICVSLVSWGVTAGLAYCVQHWAPDVLPDNVLDVAYRFGWACLFITAMPSVAMYGVAVCSARSFRGRHVVGLVLASIPYILMLCWWARSPCNEQGATDRICGVVGTDECDSGNLCRWWR